MILDPRGNVISFPAPVDPQSASDDRCVTGPARCIGCRHEWQGVVLYAKRLDPLECPSCGRMKGLLIQPYVPDGQVWKCDCGNDLFYVLPTGMHCPNCGETARFP